VTCPPFGIPEADIAAHSNLLHLLASKIIQRREVADLNTLRAHEHAGVGSALEIPLSLDTTVVLACRLVERDADPQA